MAGAHSFAAGAVASCRRGRRRIRPVRPQRGGPGLDCRAQLGQNEMAPHGDRAGPGEHVPGDADQGGAQGDLIGGDAGLVRQIRGDGEETDPAQALGPPDLGRGPRVAGDADAVGCGRRALLGLLALLAVLALLGGGLVVLGHDARSYRWSPRVRARAARMQSKTNRMRRCRSSSAISSNTRARLPSSRMRTTRATPWTGTCRPPSAMLKGTCWPGWSSSPPTRSIPPPLTSTV